MHPHVLIFPLPLQSTINSHLKLAELICAAGIQVTFLNTDHMHRRLLRHTDIQSRFSHYTNFHFLTFPDGLPEDHKRCGDVCMEMIESIGAVTGPLLKNYLLDLRRGCSPNVTDPVTCIIAEAIYSWAIDIAEDVGIPLIYFETISPCTHWIYTCLPTLIEAGEVPIKGNDLDGKITCIPGMESFLRRRDLPDFCRGDFELNEIEPYLQEGRKVIRAQGLILNTFEHLDEQVLPYIRAHYPNLYAIGPIHSVFKLRIGSSTTRSNSLLKEDKKCLSWLDTQPSRSVIYVSIGSQANMTKAQSLELWFGLVNSGQRFLWVKRPGSIIGELQEDLVPTELIEGTKERGWIVEWAPQEEVLAHPSIGAFFTHSGWGSTLESIVEGVPMICWPCFLDQQVTSRFVSEVWKIGMDMKDTCDRVTIEKMVKNVMELRKDEFIKRAQKMAEMVSEGINEGGTSRDDFDRLIKDIRLMDVPVTGKV